MGFHRQWLRRSGDRDVHGPFLSTGGVWTNNSDRNRKTALHTVDSQAILEKPNVCFGVGSSLRIWRRWTPAPTRLPFDEARGSGLRFRRSLGYA